MDVGVGLPATIHGVERAQILEWAGAPRRVASRRLGTIDRIVYGNYEPLIALAAAAAVTERIRLATTILIAPYRANAVLLAKQAASVDHLSGGRLVLGMAVGGREDDYAASGVPFHQRGKQFDAMLGEMERAWRGDSFGHAGAIGPAPPSGRPAVVIGGTAEAAFRRAAQFDGWIMGGGTPDMFRQGAEQLQTAWRAAGRDTAPRTMALAYFALGDRAQAAAESYLSTTTTSSASTPARSPRAPPRMRRPSAATSTGSRPPAATSSSCSPAIPTRPRSTCWPTRWPDGYGAGRSYSARQRRNPGADASRRSSTCTGRRPPSAKASISARVSGHGGPSTSSPPRAPR